MRLAERIGWIIEHVEDKVALDIGCVGEDFHLHKKIKEHTRSVLGIDVNREGIERMRSEGCDVMCADAELFNANPRKFDAIVLGACLEHVDNSGMVLDRAWGNLGNGGRLIITTPNARHLGVSLKDMVSDYHNLIYTPKLISQMLKRHGFRIVETVYFRDEGKLNFVGWFYEKILLRLLPQLASKFGVVAEKAGGNDNG